MGYAVYIDGGADKPEAPIGSTGCLGGGAGYINDDLAAACWAVHAGAIIIGPSWMGVHAAAEFINMLYKSNGTQPAVPTVLDLPKATV